MQQPKVSPGRKNYGSHQESWYLRGNWLRSDRNPLTNVWAHFWSNRWTNLCPYEWLSTYATNQYLWSSSTIQTSTYSSSYLSRAYEQRPKRLSCSHSPHSYTTPRTGAHDSAQSGGGQRGTLLQHVPTLDNYLCAVAALSRCNQVAAPAIHGGAEASQKESRARAEPELPAARVLHELQPCCHTRGIGGSRQWHWFLHLHNFWLQGVWGMIHRISLKIKTQNQNTKAQQRGKSFIKYAL